MDALPGITRMRILRDDNIVSHPVDPCAHYSYAVGHAHDYTIQVTASARIDCGGEPGESALPGTPCIGSDGIAGTWTSTCECEDDINVGLAGPVDGMAMRLHPNPVHDALYIHEDAPSFINLIVHDMLGAEVFRQPRGNSPLDVAFLSPGHYTIQLLDGAGRMVARGRFLKQ